MAGKALLTMSARWRGNLLPIRNQIGTDFCWPRRLWEAMLDGTTGRGLANGRKERRKRAWELKRQGWKSQDG